MKGEITEAIVGVCVCMWRGQEELPSTNPGRQPNEEDLQVSCSSNSEEN